MKRQEPRRTAVSSVNELIHSNIALAKVRPYICDNFAVIHQVDSYSVFKSLLEYDITYRADDFRFMVVRKGEADVSANLIKYHIAPNMVSYVGTGSLIQFDNVSSDVTVSGLLIKDGYMRMVMGSRIPALFNGNIRNFALHVTPQERDVAESLLAALLALVKVEDSGSDAVAAAIAAIVHYFVGLHDRHSETSSTPQTHQQRVFEQFIALVNEHCARHHTLDFYADKLCITQRYLGTLVRQVSGATAKQWIDRAIINQAKVALRHSDVTITQLADALAFPNASFFCKYFKRLTGMTPSQFQRQ